MKKEMITGRERERDEAEKWLVENDPDYAESKKKWQTPSTDALARDRGTHPSLQDLTPLTPRADGNYYRRHAHSEQADGSFNIENLENDDA